MAVSKQSADVDAGLRGDTDIAATVGANLRRLRRKRGLSLEGLARRSGVSRSMISQTELGQSAPTIGLLWRVARALDVTFSELVARSGIEPRVLAAATARILTSPGGSFSSRALFPSDQPVRAAFYELRLRVGGEELAEPYAPGTVHNLIVAVGSVDVAVGAAAYHLDRGDAILFSADVPHRYSNTSGIEAVFYLVVSYPESGG